MRSQAEIKEAINRGDYDGFELTLNRTDLVAAALDSIAAIEGDAASKRPIALFDLLRQSISIVDELESTLAKRGVELTDEERQQHARRIVESLAAYQAVGGTLTNMVTRAYDDLTWRDVLEQARSFLDAVREEHGGPIT